MELLLSNGYCNPNAIDFTETHNLLSYAYIKQNYRALDLLLSQHDIDANNENEDKSTLYGILISQLYNKEYERLGYKTEKYLQKIITEQPNLKIRLHFPQAFFRNQLLTPVALYLMKRGIAKGKIYDKSTEQKPSWKLFFGDNLFRV